MATKLRFPQTAVRSWKLVFPRAADAAAREDLTGATFAAYIKRSLFDADEDALVDIADWITALGPENGEAVMTTVPADLEDVDPFLSAHWQVRATLSDGRVLELDAHRGPLVFDPLTGDPEIAEPDNDHIEAYSPGTAGSGAQLTAITGLTGGTSADLDGMTAAQLAFLPVGSVIELYFSGSIVAKYRRRLRSPANEAEVGAAAGGFLIVCDNATTTAWELLSVHKQGVPCTWNTDTELWHQQLATGSGDGVSPALAQEADAFSLPA